MDTGIQMFFPSHGWKGLSDSQVWDDEVSIADLAEPLGFDTIWAVEHHFFDYAFCPDNLQFLAFMAARTSRIHLGTAAIILPWNDPLRVAEKVAVLDQLSGGRFRLGFGRGLSRREFAPFRGIKMEESRERFDEAAAMIVDALETGSIKGEGRYYPQPEIAIRPKPAHTFKGRTYAVANSPESVDACARIGARMMMFAERNWEGRLHVLSRYRETFTKLHNVDVPPPVTFDLTYCHRDSETATERGTLYLATYLQSILEHYEIAGGHFGNMPGYELYEKGAVALREAGFDKYLAGFLAANAFGTPDQILEQLDRRRKLLGCFDLGTGFRFGGIPIDQARESMSLFAKEVLPVVKGWT